MPDACVRAIREDFYAYYAAVHDHSAYDGKGPVQDAYDAHYEDAWRCQAAFPDESPVNRLTYGDIVPQEPSSSPPPT